MQDCYFDSHTNAPIDGSARVDGQCEARVLRGGSWPYGAEDMRSANRIKSSPSNTYENGFRLAQNN